MTPTTNQALHVEPAGSPAPSPMRVILADRVGTARHVLAGLIAGLPGVQLVGVTDDDAELTRILGRARPDVVVVDDRMVDDRPLAAYGMDVRVIVMGMDDDRRFAERAERLGAVAWIPKEHADEFLPLLIGGAPLPSGRNGEPLARRFAAAPRRDPRRDRRPRPRR